MLIIMLSDGETAGLLDGCQILELPDVNHMDEVEGAIADIYDLPIEDYRKLVKGDIRVNADGLVTYKPNSDAPSIVLPLRSL